MPKHTSLPVAVGLDIGTSAVRCIIGIQEEDSPVPSVIGFGEAPNRGVRKGVVANIEETVSSITTALDEATRIAGIDINHASVGVNGSHLVSINSHGIIAVGSGNREINEQDVSRVEEAATVIQLPPNRETIQAFPRNYQIDGQEHIQDPVGMNGMRLEVDTCLVTAASPFIKNLSRAVHQAGFNIDSLAANPLAAAAAVVTPQHKEQGVLLMDIGVSTTGLAVFEEGDLLHVAVLPLGSGHITGDLAIGLRTEMETAEQVKLKHVDCAPKQLLASSDGNVKVKELSGEFLVISKREINNIAASRLEETFDLVSRELKKINRDGMLPGGVILTGGGANLSNIDEYAKQALRLPAHIGKPSGFSGVIDKIMDPAYACAIGLMVENIQTSSRGGALDGASAAAERVNEWLKHLYRRWRK